MINGKGTTCVALLKPLNTSQTEIKNRITTILENVKQRQASFSQLYEVKLCLPWEAIPPFVRLDLPEFSWTDERLYFTSVDDAGAELGSIIIPWDQISKGFIVDPVRFVFNLKNGLAVYVTVKGVN